MDRNELKYFALAELGYTEKPNFDSDDDNGVNIINEIYPRIYSLALQSYEWSFAKAKESMIGAANTGRYTHVFQLPSDCEYIQGLYTDEKLSCPLHRYDRNGEFIYANEPVVHVVYTKKVCEEDLPAYFTEYMIYLLARKCCTKVTGDGDLLQELIQNEQNEFALAKNTDIKQAQVRLLNSGAFTDVRF